MAHESDPRAANHPLGRAVKEEVLRHAGHRARHDEQSEPEQRRGRRRTGGEALEDRPGGERLGESGRRGRKSEQEGGGQRGPVRPEIRRELTNGTAGVCTHRHEYVSTQLRTKPPGQKPTAGEADTGAQASGRPCSAVCGKADFLHGSRWSMLGHVPATTSPCPGAGAT